MRFFRSIIMKGDQSDRGRFARVSTDKTRRTYQFTLGTSLAVLTPIGQSEK